MIIVPPKYEPLYDTKKPIILVTGGRGGAKSFHVSTFAKRLSYQKGHKILYTRYTLSSADVSIIPEVVQKMEMEGDTKYFTITKKDIINTVSGSQILFRGIKTSSGNQTANLKSIQGLTTFVIDEAEEWISEDDYDKLRLSIRQKGMHNRTIPIMNPTDSDHFIYTKYIKDTHRIEVIDGVPVQISTHPDVEHIHTTYLDNLEYLSDEFLNDVRQIKAIHDSLPEEFKISSKYALKIIGRWSDRKEGAIFGNWSEGEFDTSLTYCYGQDYGFSVDPTTLVKVAIDTKRMKIYCEELMYSSAQLGTDEIHNGNMSLIHNQNDLIVADSAEDRLIVELRQKGLNIVGAEKGPGSIRAGITRLQDFEIVVSPNSVNLKQELMNYIWNDKKAGIPVDKHNHLIDPIRYALKQLDKPALFIG